MKHLVERVLAGEELERAEARAVLKCPDEHLTELLGAALSVREATFGRRVKICVLRNAQSGICPEDCHYCSQSRISRADISVYKLQSRDTAALIQNTCDLFPKTCDRSHCTA